MSDQIDISTESQPTVGFSQEGPGAQHVRDYHLISLSIRTSDGSDPVDIKPLFVELNYYEDIFSSVTCGDVVISDAQGMIEKLGLNGNEYIKFTLAKDVDTPDDPQSTIDKQFRIYKIGGRQKGTVEAAENYILYFASDEMLINSQYRISKSYPYMSIKDMVTDILQNYLQVADARFDPDRLEETDGSYNFIIPNLKPFEAINWLMQYARPADTTSIGNDMIFFEDSDSYVMASLQTLFTQPSIGTFKYEPKNMHPTDYVDSSSNDLNRFMFNIDQYEIVTSFDTMHGVNSGTMANQLMALNPLTQSYNVHTFSYSDYSTTAKSLNPINSDGTGSLPIVNNLQNRNGDSITQTAQANFKLAFSNTDNDQNDYISSKPQGSVTNSVFIEDVLTMRKAQLSLTNYHKMKLMMAGNPFLTVGQVMTFDLISTTPSGDPDNPKGSDALYSGNYLISATRHLITTGGYSTILEIVKESLPTDADTVGLPTADNSDPDVQGSVDETQDWY
jgi:hypothetical protein